MVPPRFESPTHPCPRCGAVVGGFAGFRAEHLPHVGWAAQPRRDLRELVRARPVLVLAVTAMSGLITGSWPRPEVRVARFSP